MSHVSSAFERNGNEQSLVLAVYGSEGDRHIIYLYTCLLVEIPSKYFSCPWLTQKTNNPNTEQD